MPQQFYTVRQTADILNVSYQTAFRKITKKEIPSMRMGRKILVPSVFIDNLVSQAMAAVSTAPVPAWA
jgi:excisionase family DNA binding protein